MEDEAIVVVCALRRLGDPKVGTMGCQSGGFIHFFEIKGRPTSGNFQWEFFRVIERSEQWSVGKKTWT